MQADIHNLLTTTPPTFTAQAATRIAADHFAIQAVAKLLVSDRDQNFYLQADDGQRYTLKIANRAEQLSAIEFQNRALHHVATQDPSLLIPRVIPTRDGRLHCALEQQGNRHIVRMLSWLDGAPLHTTRNDPELKQSLGKILARLGLALQSFNPSGSSTPSLWDMKNASGLRELLSHIRAPDLRLMLERVLDRFDQRVQPKLQHLRTQVIHNDLNPDNVLLDRSKPTRITGIIDFGDLVNSPLIFDLAVAATYQLAAGDDPLAGVLPMIAGYHAVRPLQAIEMKLLVDLIQTRLATSVIVNSYRTKLFPQNRQYQMTNYAYAKNNLLKLMQQPEKNATERIFAAWRD